jgi:hypothetical protein
LAASGCSSNGSPSAPAAPGPGSPDCGADLSSDVRNCGVCGNVCGANTYCKAGGCVPGCPERTLYVSPAGDDLNYGCSKDAPKKTLGNALSTARENHIEGHTIQVCEGTYSERGLSLDLPISLRGGYDCSFAGTGKKTILDNADVATSGATLNVRGAEVTSSVLVDGFTIRGGGGDRGGGAVLVSTGAAAVLSNNEISGGDSTDAGDSIGSYGIYVQAGASPEITKNTIDGGSGTAKGSFGSIGIAVARDAGKPHIHDNRIRGGSGTSTLGIASTGIYLSGKEPVVVENNTIAAGGGHVLGAAGTGGIGVFVLEAGAATLRKNNIDAGTANCVGPCAVHGVSISKTADVQLQANRIYGGDASAAEASTWGVLAADSAGTVLTNNMVHGGGKANVVKSATAVELRTTSGAHVWGNTLYGSSGAAGGQGIALGITRGATGTVVQGNLATGLRSGDLGLLVFACPTGSSVQSFQNNVFLNYGTSVASTVTTTTVACDTTSPVASVSALESFLGAGASQNARIAANCAGDGQSACRTPAACSSESAACLESVFSAWSTAESGYPELMSSGWRLRNTAPCFIARGGRDLQASLSDDAFGTRRAMPVSAGAEELEPVNSCTE